MEGSTCRLDRFKSVAFLECLMLSTNYLLRTRLQRLLQQILCRLPTHTGLLRDYLTSFPDLTPIRYNASCSCDQCRIIRESVLGYLVHNRGSRSLRWCSSRERTVFQSPTTMVQLARIREVECIRCLGTRDEFNKV